MYGEEEKKYYYLMRHLCVYKYGGAIYSQEISSISVSKCRVLQTRQCHHLS